MLRGILRRPVGIAGLLVLVFGLLLAFNYDPAEYEQQDPYTVTDQSEAVRIMVRNTELARERDMRLIMTWGSIVFGLLMLGNAAWEISRAAKEQAPDRSGPGAPLEPH